MLGYPDHRVNPDSPFLETPESYFDSGEYFNFLINDGYYSTSSYLDLLKANGFSITFKPDYVFIELPPFLHNSFPPGLIASADLAVLVCRANRVWSSADQGALDLIQKVATQEPVALINGVELEAIESVLGDLPKKRSRLRRISKNIVRLQFYTRHQP
jgi:hypothetical protein